MRSPPHRPAAPAVLETDRLILRRFVPGDGPFILRLLNEPGFLRFIGDRNVRTVEDAEAYLARVPLASYREHGFGPYRVERKAAPAPIGMCGLMRKPWLDAPDLAYAFLAEFGRQGYALEAARAVMEHARASLDLTRILAVVLPGNVASIRLLRKLGFEPAGTVLDPADRATLQLHVSGPDRPSARMDPIRVRAATVDDVGLIVRILIDSKVESFGADVEDHDLDAPFWEDRWRRYLTEGSRAQMSLGDGFAFVAEAGGEAVGFAAYHHTERHGADAELQSIYVLKPWQRRGVGTALLAEIARRLERDGSRSLCVGFWSESPYRAFYYKHGAVEINPHWAVWQDIHALLDRLRQIH